jgi:drug/metabolite transporter (DMT)-like permease
VPIKSSHTRRKFKDISMASQHSAHSFRNGVLLVAGSALVWSIGGTISRFLAVQDSWTVVFWRSFFAASFLLVYMLVTSGPAATGAMFRNMGWAGLAVAGCFAVASTSFVVALAYTTVANILLMQAGVPLLAALLAWILFGETVSMATKLAIAAVIAGVGIMVSESLTGQVSPIGDGLAVLIACAFAVATVLTRRHSEVAMLPAVCLATTMAGIFASFMAQGFAVSPPDLGLLVVFGAINLGAGLAMFSNGARLIPAALAALIGTLEPVLGPIWVWLIHHEVPSLRTLIGGIVVFVALLVHLLVQARMQPQIKEELPHAY